MSREISSKPFFYGGILTFGLIAALLLPGFYYLAFRPYADLAALSLRGDDRWYRDIGGIVPEIQDQDIFYHGLGDSVAVARTADIIILGSSYSAYAFDPALLKAFGERHNIRIYNLSFQAVRGGGFSKRLIEKWQIRPKLWVINADDYIINFFSAPLTLTFGPLTLPIPTVDYSRWTAVTQVLRRNLVWRIEDYIDRLRDAPFRPAIYRNIDDGAIYIDSPGAHISNDQLIPPSNRTDCHTDQSNIDYARQYLADIGGVSILTLVPHNSYCPQQVREIATAVGAETILTPNANYTSLDGGGHLDQAGAAKFTEYFLKQMESSPAFKAAFPSAATNQAD